MLIVLGVALFEPHTFRFLLGQFIRLEAWRNGVSAQVGAIDGSLLEPLVLRDSVWLYESGTGPITRVEVANATAEFSWRNLLSRGSGKWFQRLTVTGLRGKIQFPLETTEFAPPAPAMSWRLPLPNTRWLPAPERIEAEDVDFIFQSNADYVRLADTRFTLSKVEAGTIRAGQIAIKQPWLNRTFRDVRGTTAIRDAKVEVADLTLEPGVEVRSFSAEIDELARGQLNLSLRLEAFGGEIRMDARTLSSERPFSFEATVSFSQMNIAGLANFLRVSEAAGGTIKQGTFKFRGPPQQISRATASLRLEATNFQWDSRQWDALVLGATLMDGRVQVPELALAQGHNRLNLNGEMPLPTPGIPWWKSAFSVNIAAQIDNLTELSALMLPEFKFAAGKANINGSIRGKDQQFNGQLIVSGSELKWRNAPIEQLHAGVTLNGNEFQVTNVSLFNHGDYLRGRGVVNIIGDKQYWGEIHASIEDLAKYSALLAKPIVPEPLAGGAVIDWSGEGSAKGHSGQFSARLHKLRSLGATAALLHPINADLNGTYAPGRMQFSRFALSDDESSFTANVGVGNKALSVQGIKLYHRQALWLEGDALLPLDVWKAWPNTSLDTLLDDQTVSKVNLTAYNLGLRQASLLTGWKFPIDGVVLGNFTAEGPLGGLKMSGKLTLSKAQIPLGGSGDLLTGVTAEATFDGPALLVKKLTGRHPAGDFAASGQVTLTDLRDPTIELALTTEKTALPIFTAEHAASLATVSSQLQIAGPLSSATVSGAAQILSFATTASEFRTWFPEANGISMPPVFSLKMEPWNAWRLEVAIDTPQPALAQWNPPSAAEAPGNLQAKLRLTGTGAAPILSGEATLRGLPLRAGTTTLRMDEATLQFREGFAENPSIVARATGVAFGEPFAVQVTGTAQFPMRFFVFAPPLTEKIIAAELTGSDPASSAQTPPRLELRVPAALFEGVEIADWPVITTPLPAPALVPPALSEPAPVP